MRTRDMLLAVAASMVLTIPAAAQTQITTAVIEGVVVDTSGAVLPGVEVEVRNVDTTFRRTLTTDREGRFAALQLPSGLYTLTFTLQNFATVVQENVRVTIGEAVRVNPTMKLSGVAETVTVSTQAATVDATRVAAASTLNERTIETTPILGRKFEDLLTLTPGVSVVQGPDGDEITFAGQRGVFNNVSLDGGDYNNGFFGEQLGGQRAAIDIPLDAVKEFQVVATGATACPVTTPTISAHEALINSNDDCARLALINFIRTTRSQEEGLPIKHPIRNYAFLLKSDFNITKSNQLGISYNFDYSKNTNQTFDVATYGNSANGIEGPSKINNFNLNDFATVSATMLNEAHFSYTRELRPRAAVTSNVPADTAMGFATTFRFGSPFFLEPTIDELIWRTDAKDNFSIIHGSHTIKFGGEWLHTLNDQVFRGFFTGRYIFDSVAGFLRYASPAAAGGFGPRTLECANAAGA